MVCLTLTFAPSFGHAQVAVTNDVHRHLGEPKFLFCPTEYCATRAVPCVKTSEYLMTLGEKLHPAIDIMWTGPQVSMKEGCEDEREIVNTVVKP
jgi:protein O-GlcNAcase/histone acetyltransferase